MVPSRRQPHITPIPIHTVGNTADFNHDGILDLADASSVYVFVFLGKGDGTFQEAVPYPLYGTWIGAADFNADGKLDLAMPPDVPKITASMFLGNGNGTFGLPTDYYYGSQPAEQLAIGDFNGDGKLDLAGTVSGSNAVSILLQNDFVSISRPSISFGTGVLDTASPAQTVTLTNTGPSLLTINNIALTGSNPGDFTEKNNCGASLPPGGHCDIEASFAPTQVGALTAGITITDSDPSSPQTVSLSGYGAHAGPNATVSPTGLTFATQLLNTTSSEQTVTLTNYGTDTLIITGSSIQGDFGQTRHCGDSLAPKASCTFEVNFTPKAIGNLSGRLSITDNAPGGTQTVSLAGVSTEVELNPSSLYFHCTSEEQTKLTNVGSSALIISGITLTGSSEYTETNNCGNSVERGGSCVIKVTLNSGGRPTGDVSISDNGGASPQQVNLGARCGGP